MAHVVIVDAAGRPVFVAILARGGPKVGLCIEVVNIVVLGSKREQESYVINQRIGCDVVITGQFIQCQTLAPLGRGRT